MNDLGDLAPGEAERLVLLMRTNLEIMKRRDNLRRDYLEAESKIAANIRDQRLQSQISQEQLANRITAFDFHQSTIAKIEAGKRPLRIAEMFAIADALSVPWTYLMESGRVVDYEPDHDRLPVDLMEAGIESLMSQREEMLEQLTWAFQERIDAYAELNHRLLSQMSAFSEAAAEAIRRGEADMSSVEEVVARWMTAVEATARRRQRYENQDHQQWIEQRLEAEKARDLEARSLVQEFLEWRRSADARDTDGTTAHPAE